MGFGDKIRNLFGGSSESSSAETEGFDGMGDDTMPEGGAPMPESGPSPEELEELRQENQELREQLQETAEEREARMARVEERQQELEQEKDELEGEVQNANQKVQQMQQEQRHGTVQTPAPDSEYLKGTPVISADGNQFFGLFVEWINERGKIGIKTRDPQDSSIRQKVMGADRISDLCIDAQQLREKDVIILKLDGNKEKMEIPSVRRHQEILQDKERLEDKARSFSQENDTLIEKKKEQQQLIEKLMTALSMERMNKARQGGADKDIALSRMANENEMMKARMENQTERLNQSQNRESDIIETYEDLRSEDMGKLGRTEEERVMERFRELMGDGVHTFQEVLNQLDRSQQEALLRGRSSPQEVMSVIEDDD